MSLAAPPDRNAMPVVCQVDDLDLDGFGAAAGAFGLERYGYAVTPNVDHLLRYYDEPRFRELYRAASFVLLDSRVVAGTLRLKGQRLPVCTGADLTVALLGQVAGKSERIVLIGGSRDQARVIAERFALRDVRHYEPPMGFILDAAQVERCAEFIENAAPFRFCFLAVGSPQQEMLAHALYQRARASGLALCVGAALNFISGAERRAPRWMQRSALEWLYRLGSDPARLAARYLIRGPRIFVLLSRNRLTLSLRRAEAAHLPAASPPPRPCSP
jgi:exopolysaccharide biosynthesis WecB/TagA/CpsF family protein